MIEVPADPNSRIKISNIPVAAPGKCVICGAVDGGDESPRRRFVEFGLNLARYGVVYFCTHCLRQISEETGFWHSSLFKEILNERNEFRAKYEKLKTEFGDYTNAARRLLANCTCSSGFDSSDSNDSSDDDSPERTESSPEQSAGDDKSSDESSVIEGSNGVHDATSINTSSKRK